MTIHRRIRSLVLAALLSAAVVAWPSAQQATDAVTVTLSDPARIADVRIEVFTGNVEIRGENRKDVLVTPRSRNDNNDDNRPGRGGRRGRAGGAADPDATGLTRLTQSGGFSITEANNVVSIESGPARPVDIEVRVPSRTNLRVEGTNGQQITVDGVEGDIEIAHTNGGIRAVNVAGSVVAETTNGAVTVVLTRMVADKAMAFASLNGNVDVTLPRTAKATLRMQTENGDVYTDFEIQTRATTAQQRVGGGGPRSLDVNRAIVGSINGGGPEFTLRTFNGNIYLRRGPQ
jgi:hypothetical protein